MTELLFTEDEWNTAMPKVVADMTAYLRPYRAAIYEHHAAAEDDEEHGTGWGSGSYLRLGDKVCILTNEHVSCARRDNRVLAHQFDGQEDIRRIVGDHVEYPYTPKPKGDATADAAGPKARATAKKAGGR